MSPFSFNCFRFYNFGGEVHVTKWLQTITIGIVSFGKYSRSCEWVGALLRPLILVLIPRGMSDRSIWVSRAHTHVDQGLAHEVTMSYSRRPGTKSARIEPSCTTSHILMALQTIGDLFFLVAFIPGFMNLHTYLQWFQRFIHTHKQTHELAQLLLMFSNYMYFRELDVDLAGVQKFQVLFENKRCHPWS